MYSRERLQSILAIVSLLLLVGHLDASQTPARQGQPGGHQRSNGAAGHHNHNHHHHQPDVHVPLSSVALRQPLLAVAVPPTHRFHHGLPAGHQNPPLRHANRPQLPPVGLLNSWIRNEPRPTTGPLEVPAQPALVEPPKALNLTELCAASNVNVEKQLLAYVSGIEAITGTIQELDEAVQQMRPRSCPEMQPALEIPKPSKPTTTTTTTTTVTPTPDPGEIGIETTKASAGSTSTATTTTESPLETTSSTGAFEEAAEVSGAKKPQSPSPPMDGFETSSEMKTQVADESFTDSPPILISSDSGRARRQAPLTTSMATSTTMATTTTTTTTNTPSPPVVVNSQETPFFGLPMSSSSSSSWSLSTNSSPVMNDQSSEDLNKASNDLKALRKDLSSTAEWLRQTNHTVHSAMLRALQAYVSSIERRIDHQRQMYAQTRSAVLKTKVAAIKEKVANLMERLRTLIPFKTTNVISRDDHVANSTVGYPTTMTTTLASISN